MKRGKIRYPITKERLKNQFLNVVRNPFNMIVFFSLIILFCLIVIPLLQMVASTFTAAKSEIRRIGGKPGNLADPQGTATRAEIATIFSNFIK